MKNFYLIPNCEKPEAVRFAARVKDYIETHEGTAIIAETDGNGHVDPKALPYNIDAVITLGGDGTIIQAARDLRSLSVPVLGINLGRLGFLAEVQRDNFEHAIDVLLSDSYYIDERIMLYGRVEREGEIIHENYGLNDIVVHYGHTYKAIYFDLFVDGDELQKYHADGMILATPTGSTAYNLSAGGPIVMPSAELILATPVNPHTLLQRSVVLPDNVEITLKIAGNPDDTAAINFDSTLYDDLKFGDEIRVVSAEEKVKFIKLEKNSFIGVLHTKLEN